MQIQAAQTRLIKKQLDQQGQATLQLIQSATPLTTDGNVGRQLNVVA